jgi:hypothetical protein
MYGYKPVWVWRRRDWFRQRKPYNLPLSFTLRDYRVVKYSGGDGADKSEYYDGNNGFSTSLRDESFNAAYSQFKAQLGEAASLSVTVAEHKQALLMIERRASQLYKFVRDLRRLNFSGASKALGLQKPPRNLKRNAKSFSSNYLEFHFGWVPLVKDIGQAVEVLQRGIPPFFIRGRGRSRLSKWTESYSTSYFWKADFQEQCSCQIGAFVDVTNPNLWRANQLGFVNPALVAWELVPFSFVVDWFVNVSDFLGQFTDFYGLTLSKPRTTYLQLSEKSELYAPRGKATSWKSVDLERSLSIAGPALRVRNPWTLSPRRGLAAISLLIQRMR